MSSERSVTAQDIMTSDPVTVEPDLSVKGAAKIMIDHGVGALPVLDGEKLVGIVTEGDLIAQDIQLEFPTYLHLLDGMVMYPPVSAHLQDHAARAAAATVGDVMTARPLTVALDATVEDVATLMIERDVGRVLVTDQSGRLAGIVSKSDIVRSLMTE